MKSFFLSFFARPKFSHRFRLTSSIFLSFYALLLLPGDALASPGSSDGFQWAQYVGHPEWLGNSPQEACEKYGAELPIDYWPLTAVASYGNYIDIRNCHSGYGGGRDMFSVGRMPACARNSGTYPTCAPPVVNKNQGPSSSCAAPTHTRNPIHTATGNKYLSDSDYRTAGSSGLNFNRYYNSQNTLAVSTLGTAWHHTYDSAIINNLSIQGVNAVLVIRASGTSYSFAVNGTTFTSQDADITDTLVAITDGAGKLIGYRYTLAADNSVEIYDVTGKLLSIQSRSGLLQTLTYSDVNTPVNVAPKSGLLIRVSDQFGGQLNFTYDASNRIASMTDPTNSQYLYSYDSSNNLASVTYPDQKTKTYLYNESAYTGGANLPNVLTGIVDENGIRFASYFYDAQGRAYKENQAGGVNQYQISFSTDGSNSTITDPLGTARVTHFQTVLGAIKTTGQNQPGGAGCGPSSSAVTYDSKGNVGSRADFNGNITNYTYDLTRNLETSRTEAYGTAKARTITTTWHPTYHLPDVITEPGKTTDHDYDASGNLTSKTITDTALNKSRAWTYTHNSLGQVLTVNGPRTDVTDTTTYSYYSSASSVVGSVHSIGDLATVTDALGHVTSITNYDLNGRPLSITDANGVITTLTYWPRGWLKTRTVNGVQTTSYDYDGVGQVTKVTQPDGSYLSYTYDTAHRLTDITDNLGNKIHYTLDAMSNRTKEETFDPSNALKQVRSREYDALNRLKKDIGGTNPSTQITQYTYDNNGNLKSTTDPLSRVTSSDYDPLDRLIQITDPALGVTKSGLNALDQQTSVTDPRNVVTNYTPNALGDVTQTQSPDSGTANVLYDAAGNITQKTDARGVVSVFVYDALNRLTGIAYPANTAENVSFTYDSTTSGNKGIGRLTGYSNDGATTTLVYDVYGNVTQQADLIGSQIYTTSYQYDNMNRVNQITYPSGRIVTYGRNTLGQINLVQTRDSSAAPLVTLINTTAYEPFGPIKSLTYSNAVTSTFDHDADYRVSRITNNSIPVWDFVYSYDAAGSIKNITDQVSSFSRTLDYDSLYRVITDTSNIGTWTYQYDATGNRTKKINTGTQTLTFAATSNRITKIGSATQTLDAAGNLITNGTKTYAYNSANRLLTYSASAVVKAEMRYNAIGQRTQKLQIARPIHFHYDRSGHYLATTTYNSNGSLYQRTEWVYLDDMPIAQTRTQYNSNGSVNSRRTNYIHVDHLNTPRTMTDAAKAIVWRWDGDAYGQTVPNQNPDGDGTSIVLDLRFPGQYFDTETGFYYNGFRDYDPIIGQYVESDPINGASR